MNKEYIVKHNLMEAHKQFMRLTEGPLYHNLEEAGEEEQPQPQGPGAPQGGDMPQGDMQGQAPMEQPQGEGMPQGGQDMPPIGPDANGAGDMPDMPQGGDMPPMDMGAQPPMGDDELDPNVDDTVLDVEDLTQAQEKLNKKQNDIGHDLGDVDNRITALLTAVEKMQGSLDKNNSDIESLKAELEKRVPTQTEKLNMQSLKMYPYNVSPNDYWDKKELDGRYQAEGDEDKKKLEITNADVDDYNTNEIEKSFDDELHQTMKDIFKGF